MATKIGLQAQEVSRQNPWWRDARWARTDGDLRDAAATSLSYHSHILDELTPASLYLLRGPRRVGKTVAVKQTIRDLLEAGTPPTSIVRIAADGWAAKDIRTVVQNTALPLIPAGCERTWFFDEISAVTGDWAQQIKWLRDNDPGFRSATVVLTGSNAAALTAAAGTLAGRRGPDGATDRTLLPIGFRTFTSLVRRALLQPTTELPADSIDPSDLHTAVGRAAFEAMLPWLDDLVRLWETYLSYGGFPRAVAAASLGKPIPPGAIEDLFNVIAGDAFRNSRLGVATEMALLDRLWGSMASPANLSNVATDIGVSHDIVARHVGYLHDAYLLWRCPQRDDNEWIGRPRAQDKIYAIDPLVARMAHLRNASRADIDPTVLTEMQLGMMIRRSIIRSNPTSLQDDFVFHVRTPARKEIDFVAEDFAGAAIEGKYCEDGSWHADAATVNASPWHGILATRNVLDLNSDRAWAVPSGILAYLLDT